MIEIMIFLRIWQHLSVILGTGQSLKSGNWWKIVKPVGFINKGLCFFAFESFLISSLTAFLLKQYFSRKNQNCFSESYFDFFTDLFL